MHKKAMLMVAVLLTLSLMVAGCQQQATPEQQAPQGPQQGGSAAPFPGGQASTLGLTGQDTPQQAPQQGRRPLAKGGGLRGIQR